MGKKHKSIVFFFKLVQKMFVMDLKKLENSLEVRKDESVKIEIKMEFSGSLLGEWDFCLGDFVLVVLKINRALGIGKLSISCLFPAW